MFTGGRFSQDREKGGWEGGAGAVLRRVQTHVEEGDKQVDHLLVAVHRRRLAMFFVALMTALYVMSGSIPRAAANLPSPGNCEEWQENHVMYEVEGFDIVEYTCKCYYTIGPP